MSHKVKFYIGDRDGKRVFVSVDGYLEAGREYIPAKSAHLIDEVLAGGSYDHLEYTTEDVPISSAAPSVSASSEIKTPMLVGST